jgi:hypothetical protein
LKATIHNPHTSESAKESAEERLSGMQKALGTQVSAESEGKNTGNVIGEDLFLFHRFSMLIRDLRWI